MLLLLEGMLNAANRRCGVPEDGKRKLSCRIAWGIV